MFAKKQTYIPKICSIFMLTNICSRDIVNTTKRTNVPKWCSGGGYTYEKI